MSNTLANGNASAAAVLHEHFFTRKPLFVFEPYLDSYSKKKGNKTMKTKRLIAAITVSAGLIL